MPNGELIAVKKLWKTKGDEEAAIDSFAAEIQILGHIRHRNIVKLSGYCSNKSVKLLLYNYISNGNLQQLQQSNRNLDWETRLMNSPNYQAISRVAGSYGYIAPEYGCTMNITEKSDVYNRVVLLEILSGRSAVESRVGDGLHIVDWVKKKVGSFEPTVTILDYKLRGLPDQMVQEMFQTLGFQEENHLSIGGIQDQYRSAADCINNNSASLLLYQSDHVHQKKVIFASGDNARAHDNQLPFFNIKHNNIRSDAQVSYLLAKGTQDQLHKFRNFLQGDLNHNMTQYSAVGSKASRSFVNNELYIKGYKCSKDQSLAIPKESETTKAYTYLQITSQRKSKFV